MKFFTTIQRVTLTEQILAKAKTFSETVTSTTNYSDSRQTAHEKIKNDHFVSKLGEEAARMVFSPYAKSIAGPDYNIYTHTNKSWQADLFVDGVPLAVKTQKTSAARRYGLSWTFQCGSFRKDIILQQPDAWVIFIEYDDVTPPFHTCFVLPPFQMKELKLGEPKLQYLRGHKKVVYASSLAL